MTSSVGESLSDHDPRLLNNEQAELLERIRAELLPTQDYQMSTKAELELDGAILGAAVVRAGCQTSESMQGSRIDKPFLRITVSSALPGRGENYPLDWDEPSPEDDTISTIMAFNSVTIGCYSHGGADVETLSWARAALLTFNAAPAARLSGVQKLLANFTGQKQQQRTEESMHSFGYGILLSRKTTGEWMSEEEADLEWEFAPHIIKLTVVDGKSYELHIRGNRIEEFTYSTPQHLEFNFDPTEIPVEQYHQLFDEMMAVITTARRIELRNNLLLLGCLLKVIGDQDSN